MDLQAHSIIGSSSSRWAKSLALFCFALACGLLLGSLSKGHPPVPTAALSVSSLV